MQAVPRGLRLARRLPLPPRAAQGPCRDGRRRQLSAGGSAAVPSRSRMTPIWPAQVAISAPLCAVGRIVILGGEPARPDTAKGVVLMVTAKVAPQHCLALASAAGRHAPPAHTRGHVTHWL